MITKAKVHANNTNYIQLFQNCIKNISNKTISLLQVKVLFLNHFLCLFSYYFIFFITFHYFFYFFSVCLLSFSTWALQPRPVVSPAKLRNRTVVGLHLSSFWSGLEEELHGLDLSMASCRVERRPALWSCQAEHDWRSPGGLGEGAKDGFK